jgi:toxin ParE1/3/4
VRVNWTDPAIDALDSIDEYISRDAPIYAQRFIEQLMACVDRLEEFPLSGRLVPEAERDDVREVIF